MGFSLFGLLAKVLLERRFQSLPAAIFDDRVKSIEWPFSPSNGAIAVIAVIAGIAGHPTPSSPELGKIQNLTAD